MACRSSARTPRREREWRYVRLVRWPGPVRLGLPGILSRPLERRQLRSVLDLDADRHDADLRAVRYAVEPAATTRGGSKARTGGSGSVQRSTSTSAVAELGPCASFEVPWSRVSTLALPCRQSACSPPSAGSYQAPQDKLHDAGADRVADDRAGEARAARIVDAHHVAVADAARLGVRRIDRDRLAARDLAAGADRAAIHLAVQAVARLARDEMQRIGLGVLAAEPFPRLDPGRMRRAIVVAEARDLLRIELDPAGRRAQLVLVRDRRGNRRTSRIRRRPPEFPDSRSAQNVSKSGIAAALVPALRAAARRDAAARPSRRGPACRPRQAEPLRQTR